MKVNQKRHQLVPVKYCSVPNFTTILLLKKSCTTGNEKLSLDFGSVRVSLCVNEIEQSHPAGGLYNFVKR